MPLTGTVDAANARIDFFVDFTPVAGTQTFATLYRRVGSATAEAVPVRGLFGTTLLGEQAYVSDHEAPLDQQLWYVAAGSDGTTAVFMNAGPFTIPSDGYVWMKDPGRPWADLRLDLCVNPDDGRGTCAEPEDTLAWIGFQEKVRAADAGLFSVLDAERPADVYARRKDLTTSWSFLSRARETIDSVYELYTAGGPLLLQVPDVYHMMSPYGLYDRYYQPGDLREAYISNDQRRPVRLWSAPVTTVDPPIGQPQGTDTANWCVLAETYPTYADLTATGYSWGQVASGVASTPPTSGLYGGGTYGGGLYGG